MSFSIEIQKWGAKTSAKVQRMRRGITLKLFSAVIMDTPVDTGRLRGNWRISEEQPLLQTRETVDKSGGPTINESSELIQATSGDGSIFLSNSLPYAARIEFDGHSHTKAPEGMVRKNVARFNGLVKEIVAE